jgi:hypothetical protein
MSSTTRRDVVDSAVFIRLSCQLLQNPPQRSDKSHLGVLGTREALGPRATLQGIKGTEEIAKGKKNPTLRGW